MREDNPIYGKAGTRETLEFYFVKGRKNEFRQNIADIAKYLNKNLEQIFTFKQQVADDNW